MTFDIFSDSVIYGGGPGRTAEYTPVAKNVSADYVLGFFKNVRLDNQKAVHGTFRTIPDSMGCYVVYKVVVYDLGAMP